MITPCASRKGGNVDLTMSSDDETTVDYGMEDKKILVEVLKTNRIVAIFLFDAMLVTSVAIMYIDKGLSWSIFVTSPSIYKIYLGQSRF